MTDLTANAERFSGFADLYDAVRPTPPIELGALICRYARTSSPDVVDLGSGTGLSTRWATTWAGTVIGVEPSDDMRREADRQGGGATYRPGWSHDTGLGDRCADVVLAVQALHWMDPTPTFVEATRLLRPGGVFAAIDCDWPPAVASPAVEADWDVCNANASAVVGRVDPGVRHWSKDEHLGRLSASGRFAFTREVALHVIEAGSAARLADLLRSQGGLQTMLKHGYSEDEVGLTRFRTMADDALGSGTVPFVFTYRVRLGVRRTWA